MHTGLVRRPVALAAVARGAGGDDVLPDRQAAAAARDDVVDGQAVGLVAAVLAGPRVAGEDGLAGDLAAVDVARDPDVAHQPDHAGALEREALGVELALVALEHSARSLSSSTVARRVVQTLIGS